MEGPNEITRESLVQILEIMHRLAAPEAMPELLREIMAVGKIAIVAESGVLWLLERATAELVMVVPAHEQPPRIRLGQGLPGVCAESGRMLNVTETRGDTGFAVFPVHESGRETRSVLCVPILGQDQAVLGVMQWLGVAPGQFDRHDEWVGPALAAQAAVAIQHAYMTDRLLANAILQREVAVAREIQISTLPRNMPQVPGYDVHGLFRPTDHTGGDLYDLEMLDGRLFILLGDATGHGFGPALSATQLQAMLRVAFRLGAGLDEAYVQVNNQMVEDLPDDRFITAFIGSLDPVRHRVEYHSAGQGPILHFKAATSECAWHKPTSFPLGVMELAGPIPGGRLELAPGDILALLSDGIYEFARADGAAFGERGVAAVIRQFHADSMASLSRRLVDAAFEFGAGTSQADDITLALVRRLPA